MKTPESTKETLGNTDAEIWFDMAKVVKEETGGQTTQGEKTKPPQDQLSEFFNSKGFVDQFETCEKDEKEKIVAQMLNYFVLFRDEDVSMDLDDCFEKIMDLKHRGIMSDHWDFASKMSKYFVSIASKKLDISENDPEYERKMFDFFNNRTNINGYCFHAYNGAFNDSIRRNGLIADKGQDSLLLEISKLNEEVFANYKYGHMKPFLYYLGSAESGKHDNIYFSKNSEVAYDYGSHSPEWFSLFIDSFGGKQGNQSYERRDHDGALGNIVEWCNERNVSEADKAKIITFFEKYWKLYAANENRPKVALIPNRALDNINSVTFEDLKGWLPHEVGASFAEACAEVLLDGDINTSTKKTYHQKT